MKRPSTRTLVLSALLLFAAAAQADDLVITIKDHQFTPKELTVPTGQKLKLIIKNQDPTPAEFESSDLNREKVVSAKSEITVFIGPLDAGRYVFFDDFHRTTTAGVIVAK